MFAQHWAEDEIISGQDKEMTRSVKRPSTSERYPRVDGKNVEIYLR